MKYLQYNTREKTREKINDIFSKCKQVGIFDNNTTSFAEVMSNDDYSLFFVPLDLARTKGVGYTQEDIENAIEVNVIPDFQHSYDYLDWHENRRYRFFMTHANNIDLLEAVPEMAIYRKQLGFKIYKEFDGIYFYRDELKPEDWEIIKDYTQLWEKI